MWTVGEPSSMFTGIVEATGTVTDVAGTADGTRLRIETGFEDLTPGQSIAVDGTCLTVEDHGPAEGSGNAERGTAPDGSSRGEHWFTAFLAEETVDRTTLGDRAVGDRVNLERAMPADGRFDGHVVQGHVDATATVRSIEAVGEDWRYVFELPEGCSRYVVEKGSIALDGISLTVADRSDEEFAVAVVPTTYEETTLSEREPGDRVNVEVDVMAKYVERMVADPDGE